MIRAAQVLLGAWALFLPAFLLDDCGCLAGDDDDTGDTTDSPPPVDEDGDGWHAAEDCDDGNATAYPGALETCDGIDQDCDGEADDGFAVLLWYPDVDGDGHAAGPVCDDDAVPSCKPLQGRSTDCTDCNDEDPDQYPGNPEVCDGKDQDCSGTVDEGLPVVAYCRDEDEDGYTEAPDGNPQLNFCGVDAIPYPGKWYVCAPPHDCDDQDPTSYPNADGECQ